MRAAPAYREPDGPPSEGAVCAAVQAAVSGVAVPAHFVDAVKEFANRESKLTTVIQGGRRSVYVDGGEAGPFRDFAERGGPIGGGGGHRVSRRTNATKFLERCRCAIAYRAAYLWPRSHAVHLSADMLCLVGAPAAQVPHVDLIPDQCQAVMALTRQAPTLVLRKDASPSIEEAFAKVGIDAGSTTKWADLVRAAPALALGRDEINRGMVDATRYLDPPPTDEEVAAAAQAAQGRRRRSTAGAGGVDGDCRPVSRDAWDAGSLFRGPSVGARGAALHAARAARRALHDVHGAVDRGRGGDVRPARPVHALLPRRGPVPCPTRRPRRSCTTGARRSPGTAAPTRTRAWP